MDVSSINSCDVAIILHKPAFLVISQHAIYFYYLQNKEFSSRYFPLCLTIKVTLDSDNEKLINWQHF